MKPRNKTILFLLIASTIMISKAITGCPMLTFAANNTQCTVTNPEEPESEWLWACEKVTFSPMIAYCNGANPTSEFECFGGIGWTTITRKFYQSIAEPDCATCIDNAVYVYENQVSVQQSWNDDTGCGGNS